MDLLQSIPTREFPPPQERPKTLDLLSHIELCHTGGCHFDCVLSNDLKFSLIQPKLHVMHIYIITLLFNIHNDSCLLSIFIFLSLTCVNLSSFRIREWLRKAHGLAGQL